MFFGECHVFFHNHVIFSAVLVVIFVVWSYGFWRRSICVCLGSSSVVTDKRGDIDDTNICPNGNTCCSIQRFIQSPSSFQTSTTSSLSSHFGCITSDMGRYKATCCDANDHRDDAKGIETGCPVGYKCEWIVHPSEEADGARRNPWNSSSPIPVCVAPKHDHGHADPFTRILPRYHLCHINAKQRTVHGLPVTQDMEDDDVEKEYTNQPARTAQLAYYSSHGRIEEIDISFKIDTVLIAIHGANRNGDDYFCSALSTTKLIQQQQQQQQQQRKRQRRRQKWSERSRYTYNNWTWNSERNVMVIAPLFIGNTDRRYMTNESFLYWDTTHDPNGPWRYGAHAMGPVSNVSSFHALDTLINAIRTHVFGEDPLHDDNEIWNFIEPGMKERELNNNKEYSTGNDCIFNNRRNRISLIGHSSGGQYLQRWSLLTSSRVWPSCSNGNSISSSSSSKNDCNEGKKFKDCNNISNYTTHRRCCCHIRAVVANPSSYVYLTPLRFDGQGGQWIDPSTSTRPCPMYNQWEWGLEDGGPYGDIPYVRRALYEDHIDIQHQGRNGSNTNNQTTVIDRIIGRYKYHRRVTYLIGNRDRCNISTHSQASLPSKPSSAWYCDSHGLEGTCMDELQGLTRYERNLRFFSSLSLAHNGDHRPHHHRRVVVPNVGHDHTMMFQSQQGLAALYH